MNKEKTFSLMCVSMRAYAAGMDIHMSVQTVTKFSLNLLLLFFCWRNLALVNVKSKNDRMHKVLQEELHTYSLYFSDLFLVSFIKSR